MPDPTIKEGDVVLLKSGGPKMTVEKVVKYAGNKGLSAKCSWFQGTNQHTKAFAISALKVANDAD